MIIKEAMELLEGMLLLHSIRARKQDKIFIATPISEAILMGVEALEYQDKYRWHDLRKNKNDLPKDEKELLLCVEYTDGTICYAKGKHIDNSFKAELVSQQLEPYTEIAWKEIERIE